MNDHDPLIGRDAELATLDSMLKSAQSGLVLLVGGPRTGKARMLRELRARSAELRYEVVPVADPTQGAAPWIVVDKHLTIDDFRWAMAPPMDDDGAPEPMSRCASTLILLYGYRPEEGFHDWFTGEFVPGLAETSEPCVVVVAGSPGDLALLEPLASRLIAIGPLPVDAVEAELRAIDATIDDRLQGGELQTYAEAISANPSLLGALRELLPLTSASGAAEDAE